MGVDNRLAPPNSPPHAPPALRALADLGEWGFSVVKRGFDPGEVRIALRSASREIQRLRCEVVALSDELTESESRARDRVRESTAAGFLGDEAMRMLAATRTAAAELEQRAAERSQQLIDDAKLRSAAVLLEMEQETGRRFNELDDLEANARAAALASTAQLRADADLYAESIRAAADAHAARVRNAAEAEAATLLGQVDEQIAELTRAARFDAEQTTREVEARVDFRFAEVDRRQSEMADRLALERLEITEQRDAADHLRTELIDLLDRLQTVAAAGLIELNADDSIDLA